MIVATFNAATGSAGKTVTYDAGRFILEGHGEITAQAIWEYGQQGQLDWASDGTRAWVASLAQAKTNSLADGRRKVQGWVWAAGVLIFLCVLVIGLAVVSTKDATRTRSDSSPVTASPSSGATAPAKQPALWVAVFTWPGGGEGNYIFNSQPFSLAGGHQLVQITARSIGDSSMTTLSWYLRSADGGGQSEIIAAPGPGNGYTHFYLPAGQYYLSSNTIAATWTLTVSEVR